MTMRATSVHFGLEVRSQRDSEALEVTLKSRDIPPHALDTEEQRGRR
jgi:hypothetical protein